jgi:hypothetical protein
MVARWREEVTLGCKDKDTGDCSMFVLEII